MRVFLAAAALALGGCSTTGLDSKAQFGCQAPEGVQCMSASGVYYNSLSNNLPALRTNSNLVTSVDDNDGASPTGKVLVRARASSAAQNGPLERGVGQRANDFAASGAVRAVPRIMRVWIAPWEDAERDLHDQSYVYVTLDSGRWLVEHTRSALQPRRMGTTALLHADVPAQASADAEPARSGFSRDLEKLAPVRPAPAN